MVSSITTVRIWSQQLALNAFKEAAESRNAGQSASGTQSRSLADVLYGGIDDADDGSEDTSLSALIASLQRQAMSGKAADPAESDGSVEDISSKAFMDALKDKLETLKTSSDTKVMAETMLKALEAGTLTVTDAVAGEQIKAWNPTDAQAGEAEKTSIDTSDWTGFLKERLTRDGNGRYVRNDDSSHVDKSTGASSYFGMIGDTYYYLSWTNPATKPDVTIQI